MWERRIAIVSTFYFIKNNRFEETLLTARMLLGDTHDLIHKAVGWMLREVGKRDLVSEKKFLNLHASQMPRTALRYAVERMTESQRKHYLKIPRNLELKGRKKEGKRCYNKLNYQ